MNTLKLPHKQAWLHDYITYENHLFTDLMTWIWYATTLTQVSLMIHFFIEGDRYVIETDGLLIKNVDYDDAGTYTCRARVLETGSLEERDIKLEVCTKRYINNWLLSNSQIHKQTHPFWAWSSLLVLSVSNMGHLKFIKTYNSSSLRIVGIILTYVLIWKKISKLTISLVVICQVLSNLGKADTK